MKIEFIEKQNPRRYRAIDVEQTPDSGVYYLSDWHYSRSKCLEQIKKETANGKRKSGIHATHV